MTGFDIYITLAIISTCLFLIKMFGVSEGLDADLGSLDSLNDNSSFELFSIQSILVFAMGTGWSGLALGIDFGYTPLVVLLLASLFGLCSVIVSSFLMSLLRKLNRSTPKAKLEVGMIGSTYVKIPFNEVGQIEITLGGKTQLVDATTDTLEGIESFKKVKVVEVVGEKLVKVVRT